jgi:peptide/nickel transport system substrate-binding protein
MIRPLSGPFALQPSSRRYHRNNGGHEDVYDPTLPQENVIFPETPTAEGTSLLQRLRTSLWFYPDILSVAVHRFRPVSYLIIYSLIALLGWRTIVYAENNPQSVLNRREPQILQEGVVGSVSTINPLYVTHNQVERDLQELVFNRLIKTDPNGNPSPELAETWAISGDGTSYTFFLRDDAKWHDGEKFTADDVIFTFTTVQALGDDDSYASEFRNVEFKKLDDYTVSLSLPETNPALLDSLALSIVPAHVFEGVQPSDIRFASFNRYPVGTGPFMIEENNGEGLFLASNPSYFRGKPEIDGIRFRFFASEKDALNAMRKFEVHTLTEASGSIIDEISLFHAYKTYSFLTPLRQKIIYFNVNHSGPLSSTSVRQALSAATDKETLINKLPLKGTPSNGPIMETSWAYDDSIDRFLFDPKRAGELLDQAGWPLSEETGYRMNGSDTLSITLSYLDTPVNAIIVENLTSQWADAGIEVIPDPQGYDRISSETVPRRNFEALLFEIETSSDPDKYNLWHSTKTEYPGLNLSGYSFERVDILLERARTENDRDLRNEDYSLFQKYLMNDMPALHLFHPNYSFIAHDTVKGIELSDAILPHHRYDSVEHWYISDDSADSK